MSRRSSFALAAVATVAALVSASPAGAAFPGRNGKIAFADDSAGSGIFTLSPDGSVALIPGANGPNAYPAWSADGRRIAFMSTRNGNAEVYVMNADGTGQRRLTNNSEFDSLPAWSPDGTKIVFQSQRDGDNELYTMNADGTEQTRITNRPGWDAEPAWSPDGRRIAFARSTIGFPIDLFTMNPDGTDVTQVPTASEHPECEDQRFDGSPDWSPDGKKLVFHRFDCTTAAWTSIRTINVDGTDERAVVEEEGGYVFFPVWSPDGSKIVFDGDLQNLYSVNADGNGRTLLRTGSGADWQPNLNSPPDCSGITATPNVLQPANRRLRLVTLGGFTDPDGDQLTVQVQGVTQDEPVVRFDARNPARNDQVLLRAKREQTGDGRVYRISLAVSDGVDRCFGGTTVEVRRHKKQPAVDSAPPSYDSFGE
jgi:Tol biopolymer transport system component